MNVISIIIWLIVSIACAIIHKGKGYSPITGFLWGFFFSIIGLIVVLLEKDKDDISGKQGLQMWQWLLIFLGVGIILIAIFLLAISRLNKIQENIGTELDIKTLNINYSSNTTINNNFENIENLYYYIKNNNFELYTNYNNTRSYFNSKNNMSLIISCIDIKDVDIETYITDSFKYSTIQEMFESKKVNINNTTWSMFNYYFQSGTGYKIFYITDYNDKRYEIEIMIDNNHYSNSVKNIEEIINTLIFK